jgi:hypothetical protein
MKLVFAGMAGVVALLSTSSVQAGNSLIATGEHGAIARSSIGVSTDGEWNRLGRSEGKQVEVWTRDGDSLNRVLFFGGIGPGQTLFKDRRPKDAPLPKVQANMLLLDLPGLLEATYRSQYRVNRMDLRKQEAITVGGVKAVRFSYDFIKADDEVERKGEAVGLLKGGKVHLMVYEAPALYFFDKDLAAFHHLVETLKL